MISVKNLTKKFPIAHNVSNKKNSLKELCVINNVSFEIPDNHWISLTGPSGSGKSTLLSLLAGLEEPTSGSIQIFNSQITKMNEEQKAAFRAFNMGFVFQSFRLLPHLTAFENICVPLELISQNNYDWAKELLNRVGLGDRASHLPSQLSGGEQQRIAVARAFATKPKVLFADEPTGNLDSKNGSEVLKLLKELQTENKSTLIVVTHDTHVASQGDSTIKLKDGVVVT